MKVTCHLSLSRFTFKVHSQGSLKVFGTRHNEGDATVTWLHATHLKVITCHLSLTKFTLKVLSQGSLSGFLAKLTVPSFETQLTCTDMMLLVLLSKIEHSFQYMSTKTFLLSKWPFPIPHTCAQLKHFFLERTTTASSYSICSAANSFPGIF